jgi:hypothetical protein
MAERVGFEPTDRVNGQRFSRPPHSTTLAPLRFLDNSPGTNTGPFQLPHHLTASLPGGWGHGGEGGIRTLG